MKKTIFTFLTILSFTTIYAQKVPVTFEPNENGASWTWAVFENDDNPALEIVANPFKTGINTSNTVAKFTARAAGQPYAGCETKHGEDIGNYKIDATNSSITIMVYKSGISDIGIKLVTSSGWSKGELKVANTKTDEWELITFDFSAVNHEDMTYDQIVIFPDFKARSAETVSYFDNLTIGKGTSGIAKMSKIEAQIYPNPATDVVNIDLNVPAADQTELTLVSALGQTVYSESIAKGTSKTSINTATLEAGVYFVSIQSATGNLYKQVVIQ
jgi:hypothetical protein